MYMLKLAPLKKLAWAGKTISNKHDPNRRPIRWNVWYCSKQLTYLFLVFSNRDAKEDPMDARATNSSSLSGVGPELGAACSFGQGYEHTYIWVASSLSRKMSPPYAYPVGGCFLH
jgi:hypothetical protein